MRPAALTLLVVIGGSACQSSSYDRVFFDDLHLAMADLEDWTLEREPGSLIFVADPDAFGDRVTITVRSSRRLEADAPGDGTTTSVIAATEAVLAAMPEARVSEPRLTRRGEMTAAYFDLTFRPRRKAERYDRRHVVLIGQRRVFHLFHTGPQGALEASAGVFEDVVASLRERS